MHSYQLSNKAVEDINDIWAYTLIEWSESQAEKYYEVLIAAFEQIASNPSLGKNYDEVIVDLKAFLVAKHIILYRLISEEKIQIERILHQSMDIDSRIDKE